MKFKWYKKLSKVFFWLIYCLVILVFADIVILRKILNFGYPRHYEEENVQRFPAPYLMFTGKPNAANHNEFGFKGKSINEVQPQSIKIAFWGGSTGYNGEPTIAEALEQELIERLGEEIDVVNFSVVSSNHRQHLHGILEYLPLYNPDFIILYGGYNELIQSGYYDPRPGYPYNHFYRAELSDIRKILIKHSAIIGTLEYQNGIISEHQNLREKWQPFSNDWNKTIVDKYFETLDLSNKLAQTIESANFDKAQLMAFYQPYQVPESFHSTHLDVKESIDSLNYVFDVSDMYDTLGKDIYKDMVHVNQDAKNLMGKKMANIVIERIQTLKNNQ